MSTNKCGMAETRNGGVLISESDSTFVENSHQTFSDVFATSDRIEAFKHTQQCFDDVIVRLPASRLLLSQIKHEYESVMATLTTSSREAANRAQRLHTRDTEKDTIRNYHRRERELDSQLACIRADNKRTKEESVKMAKQRDMARKERESALTLARCSRPRMTSGRRRNLRLSVEEAVSVSRLHKELQLVKLKLQEVEEVTAKKYVPAQKKLTLQDQLKKREVVSEQLASHTWVLQTLLLKLKKAADISHAYSSASRHGQVDPSNTSMVDYIISTALGDMKMKEDISDNERDEDPQREKEAEMVLDSFEKFNELFDGEHYEEAAILAASSPKGVLRTIDTLNKFQSSARHRPGSKPPLLLYCQALMQTAHAYRAVSEKEALQCASCALEQGEVADLSHWVAQGSLPVTAEVGTIIDQHCKCENRCFCGCKDLAFTVFQKCGAKQQAALCLVKQGRLLSFLSLVKKLSLSSEECAVLLSTAPSLTLAKCFVMPPAPHPPRMTIIQAVQVLLSTERAACTVDLLQDYQKHSGKSCTQLVMEDTRSNLDMWQQLIGGFQQAGLDDLALDFLSLLTSRLSLTRAMQSLQQEQALATDAQRTNLSQVSDQEGVFGAESSQLSSVASSSFLSGSGYTSDNYSDSDDGSEQTDC